eukprot:jgi/Botrbrau1/2288/Bobra.101_2s0111.1
MLHVKAASSYAHQGNRAMLCGPLGLRSQQVLASRTYQTGQRLVFPGHKSCRAPRCTGPVKAQAGDRVTEEKYKEVLTTQYKERSRRFRRTVFGFEEWQRHRSTGRYLRHIVGLLHSRIVWGLAWPISFLSAVAFIVCCYEEARLRKVLPPCFPSICSFPSQPFNTISFALSLLLVFRTNTSYSRWAEARKIWGGVLNRTRDITRQSLTWFNMDRKDLRELIVRWVIAFPKTLMCHLRDEHDIRRELKGILRPEEVARVVAVQHRPNFVLNVISEIIKRSRTSSIEVYRMDENLTFFADSVGACERILKTPIPLSYTRHTSRFLIMWLTFLPFALYSTCGWATILATSVIAFLLLGIEEIGVQIEEPFSILPLEAICTTSQTNLREMEATAKDIVDLVSEELNEEPILMEVESVTKPASTNGNGKSNGNTDGFLAAVAARKSSYLSGFGARPAEDVEE